MGQICRALRRLDGNDQFFKKGIRAGALRGATEGERGGKRGNIPSCPPGKKKRLLDGQREICLSEKNKRAQEETLDEEKLFLE